MDIQSDIYTQTAKAGPNGNGQTGKGAQVQVLNGLFAGAPGMNFMDMIFARITAGQQAQQGQSANSEEAGTSHSGKAAAFIAQYSLQTGDSETGTAPVISPPAFMEGENQAAIADTMHSVNKDSATNAADSKSGIAGQILEIFQNLMHGMPATAQSQIQDFNAGQGQNGLQITLKQSGNPDSEQNSPLLIATGLSPKDLTALMEKLAAQLNQAEQNDGNGSEGYMIGLVKILPPPAKNDAVLFPQKFVGALPASATASGGSESATAAAAALAAAKTTRDNAETSEQNNRLNNLLRAAGADMDVSSSKSSSGFENLLKMIEESQTQKQALNQNLSLGQNGQTAKAAESLKNALSGGTAATQNQNGAQQPSPGLSALTVGAAPPLDGLMSGAAWDSIYPDGFDFSAAAGAGKGLTLNGPGLMTSLVNNAQHAGQPHPATHMVANVIAKNAASGESRNITIRLDPPDLGRVEVRMDFNKDKNSLKTHLVVEKPETYMMLQRDAQTLERMLQGIGMDGDGSGLSFELSQNGEMFDDQNNGRGGSNDSGGGGGKNGDEEDSAEIIETTMTWHVDPETGMTHYNMLV